MTCSSADGVGGQVVLALAHAQHQRRAFAGDDHARGLGLVDDGDRVGAVQPGMAALHRVEEVGVCRAWSTRWAMTSVSVSDVKT